ncbi:hypothetical protein [Sodalis ligni]|nr:hypothetical protein [Sodalis ligni]
MLGTIFLAIRNTDPLLNPIIYAEDGVWVSMALTKGWVDAFLHARPDYFVFYNILTLYISTKISIIFSGSPLLLLPQSIAFVSYSFYSLVSVLAFTTVQRISNNYFAFLIYFIILLLPFGFSQNEILGRLLQIGYYMPFITLCLYFIRENIASFRGRIALDVLILLTAATNPIVFSVIGLYFLRKISNTNDKKSFLKEHTFILSISLLLFIYIAPHMNRVGGISTAFNPDNLIELIFARSFLYPFVFTFYNRLNDLYSIILTGAYIAFCVFSYRRTNSMIVKDIIFITFSTLLVYIIATVLIRPGLTGLLTAYNGTSGDRYFMGPNIISSFLFIICLSQFWVNDKAKLLTTSLSLYIIFIYGMGLGIIFETYQTKQAGKTTLSFYDQICQSKSTNDGTLRLIKIYPQPDWSIKVPSMYVNKLECLKN